MASSKRIVFAVWDTSISGGVRAVFEVANGLQDRGYHVKVVALQGNHTWFNVKVPVFYVRPQFALPRAGRTHAKVFVGVAATVIEMFARVFGRGRLQFLSKLANSFGCDIDWIGALANAIPECDICIATWFPTALSVWTAGKGKPFYFMQDFPEQTNKLRQERMLEATYRLPMHYLTDSNFLSELVLKSQGSAKITNVGSGIRPETFFPQGSKKSNTVMAILSDRPNKGSHTVIEALNKVHVVHPIQANFVGSDAAMRRVKPIFPYTFVPVPASAPHHDNCLRGLYSSAEVFVFSSTVEGFGLPPLEAMSCGTLVVTTDCKGNRDYAENECNCLVVPPENPGAMANAIVRLFKESKLREELLAGGLTTAKVWTWKRVIDKFEEAFRKNLAP
jgi:glycosyltransferase involved in cell wall biosynthesis